VLLYFSCVRSIGGADGKEKEVITVSVCFWTNTRLFVWCGGSAQHALNNNNDDDVHTTLQNEPMPSTLPVLRYGPTSAGTSMIEEESKARLARRQPCCCLVNSTSSRRLSSSAARGCCCCLIARPRASRATRVEPFGSPRGTNHSWRVACRVVLVVAVWYVL
jgi:hypothetical protein